MFLHGFLQKTFKESNGLLPSERKKIYSRTKVSISCKCSTKITYRRVYFPHILDKKKKICKISFFKFFVFSVALTWNGNHFVHHKEITKKNVKMYNFRIESKLANGLLYMKTVHLMLAYIYIYIFFFHDLLGWLFQWLCKQNA